MTTAGADARGRLVELHRLLVQYELVTWTSGNVSLRLTGDTMLIKPSGLSYAELSAGSMVRCDLFGKPLDDGLVPSSDAASHGYVYRHLPEVGGVVHTHSSYATAWAARGEPIPCVLTAMADEFGGEIPVGPFAPIGTDEIGAGLVQTLRSSRSPAVLMRSHGVFTVGPTAADAVKAAVMCEDVARTVHRARELGEPIPLAPQTIDQLNERYRRHYGQPPG